MAAAAGGSQGYATSLPAIPRRRFVRALAWGTLAAPSIVPRVCLGAGQQTSPSDRLTLGMIGTGGMGSHHLDWLSQQSDVEIRALCDVDEQHVQAAAEKVSAATGKDKPRTHRDFRELLADPSIDAVFVTTPDHWHALVSVAAARAGKDIYCEKPLANSVGEGRAICEAVRQNDRILQCGSHERSNSKIRFACELVRNGRLGTVRTIRIHLPCDEAHHNEARTRQRAVKPEAVPDGFDYDFWLGHTQQVPYEEKRCHFWWRFNSRYGGGEMTDRGAHVIDIAQLALGTDASGPIEYRGKGTALQGELYDAIMDFEFENLYPQGVRLVGASSGTRGLKIEGDRGWIFIHIHGGDLEAEPKELLQESTEGATVQLGRTTDHRRNFFECVRSRQAPFATAETAHRTASLCHLNNLAMRLGRPLRWDPAREQVLDDAEANALLTPQMRAPWSLG